MFGSHSRLEGAVLTVLLALVLTQPVKASPIEAQGPVWGAGVDGSLTLWFDQDSGEVGGSLTATYHWKCKNGARDEVRTFDLTKGKLAGGELLATAVLDNADWPNGYGETCRGPSGEYRKFSNEDSMRLVGQIDKRRKTVEGSASRDPTINWRVAWTDAPAVEPAPPVDPTPTETPPDDQEVQDGQG